MASPWNRHCANCIGALSFPITPARSFMHSFYLLPLQPHNCQVSTFKVNRVAATTRAYTTLLLISLLITNDQKNLYQIYIFNNFLSI